MKINTATLIRFSLLGILLPILMSIMVYTGFSTNYTTSVFSKQGFEDQYEIGVYRYRVLGKAILFKTYDLIKYYNLPTVKMYFTLNLLDPNADQQFYSAYFYMNTFFLSLASITLFFILNERPKAEDFLIADVPLLFMSFLMILSQYVVVPYDTLSYFFLAISVLLIIHDHKQLWSLFALCAIVVLATLTRETSFFILVFYLVYHYDEIRRKTIAFKINWEQSSLLILFLCFVLSYLGLRLTLGYPGSIINSFSDAFRLDENIRSIFAIFGTLFLLSMLTLFFTTKLVTKEMILFVKVSSLYIVFILLSANPWEIRLWTPLILILVIMKVRASQSLAIYREVSGSKGFSNTQSIG